MMFVHSEKDLVFVLVIYVIALILCYIEVHCEVKRLKEENALMENRLKYIKRVCDYMEQQFLEELSQRPFASREVPENNLHTSPRTAIQESEIGE